MAHRAACLVVGRSAAAVLAGVFSPRPPLTIDPATLEGDGSVLNFYAFGWGPLAVKRYRDGDQLVWEYADGSTTRMGRICNLPDKHRVPVPRGARYSLSAI